MQLLEDTMPYILWNNISPIKPLAGYGKFVESFNTVIYPDIIRDLQQGFLKYEHTIAQILDKLGLYGKYELISIAQQDFPSFLQLYSLLVLESSKFNILTPTNIFAPFQGIYRALFKAKSSINTQKQPTHKTANKSHNNGNMSNIPIPNIAIIPKYSYISGIPIKESELFESIPSARIYDLSQVFLQILKNGVENLSYTSEPDIFIINSRNIHIPQSTMFIFIKRTKKHNKLLHYINEKQDTTVFDTTITSIPWLNTWQREQTQILSLLALHKLLKTLDNSLIEQFTKQQQNNLNTLYNELANILGTNKKKYLLPTDQAYYNTALRLPVNMAQKIYNDLSKNYILVDYIAKNSKTAYLTFTPPLQLINADLNETLDILNKII